MPKQRYVSLRNMHKRLEQGYAPVKDAPTKGAQRLVLMEKSDKSEPAPKAKAKKESADD